MAEGQARVVSFIMREKNILPDLLCMEHPLHGLLLPEGPVREGEDVRRAALRIATRHSGFGTYSSISQLEDTALADADRAGHLFFKIWRNEPPGALGYWRHNLDGTPIKVRWMPMDGRIPLGYEARNWLVRCEQLLLNS